MKNVDDDDDVFWGAIPRWAYLLAISAIAGIAYVILHPCGLGT